MNKISYSDFVKQISKKTGYAQKDVKEVLNTASDIALEDLQTGDSVNVFNGLTLETRFVAEATRRNPRTGASVLVPAHRKPKAKFGSKYKEAIK